MPPAPLAKSIVPFKLPHAAVARLFASSSTWTRAFFSTASTLIALPLRRPVSLSTSSAVKIMTAAAAATSAAADAGPSGNAFSKLVGWRPSRRNFSFGSASSPSSRNKHQPRSSPSVSSVPSFASSSSSHSSSSVEGARGSRRRSLSSSAAPAEDGSDAGGSKLCSSRARAAVRLLPSYLTDARAIVQHSPSNPEGALQLSVAENRLSESPVGGLVGIAESTRAGGVGAAGEEEMRLADVLSQLASSEVARPFDGGEGAVNVFERDMISYQPTQGIQGLREAMADYLQDLLVSPTHPEISRKFNPENVVVGAGCNAVLENLCAVLADPGDAVLLPAPYYAAFEFDLVARAGCRIVAVDTLDHHDEVLSCGVPIPPEYYYPNRSSLEAAYANAVEETGRAPRILLLSHPNNPLGICYPAHVMEECIDWCREREVHLLSDEIYAGSVFREERAGGGPTFVSAMALGSGAAAEESTGLGLGPYVHLVYALSKDFALSGLRVGAAYTENEEALLPLQKLNDLCQVSSQTQLLVERMMRANAIMRSDGETDRSRRFTEVYLEANRDGIRARCDALQSCLDDAGVPYLPADSGLFVWMDFREFLPALPDGTTEATESLESKEGRERELYMSLMKDHGLLFTPGMSMRNERAGFFRCVFTAASEEEFELGLERVKKFVEEKR